MTTRNKDSNKSWVDGFCNYIHSNGKSIVDSVNVEKVCKKCIAEGDDSILTCKHMKISAVMRSSEKEDMYSGWMIESGGADIVKREILGVRVVSDNLAFDEESIDHMFDEYYKWDSESYSDTDSNNNKIGFDKIIVTVDPNAGGANEAAISIVGHLCNRNRYIIFYMVSVRCKTHKSLQSTFTESICKFNEMYPKLSKVEKLVFVETNGRFDGGAFVDTYCNLPPRLYKRVGRLSFAGHGEKYGVIKTGANSTGYIRDTAAALAMDKIQLCNTFSDKPSSKNVVKKLKLQLEMFPMVKSSEYKSLKSIGSIQDDILITLMMAVWWYRESLFNSKKLFKKWNEFI